MPKYPQKARRIFGEGLFLKAGARKNIEASTVDKVPFGTVVKVEGELLR
jgi:hypothetical protein